MMLGQEWRVVMREPAVRWATVVLLALAALCLWNGARFAASRHAEARSEVQRAIEKRAADKDLLRKEATGESPVNPWGPSEPTRAQWNAIRPPGPLAMLSFGREDMEPLSAAVSLWMTRSDNLFRKHQFESPLALAAGRFDAGFLLVLLLPLFILALGYNVVAQERESGRLTLAAVQDARIGRRLFFRLLLRVAPVYLTLLVIVMAAMLMGAPAGRLVAWGAAGLLYLLVWTGITAIVAAVPRRSELAALLAAGAWLGIAVLLPAIAGGIARAASPAPSGFEVINGARLAEVGANRRLMENLDSFVSDHPELASKETSTDDWSAKLYVSQLVVERDIAPVLRTQARSGARQRHWLAVLRYLSPTATVDAVLSALAGTDAARQASYVAQVQRFLGEWRARMSPMIFAQQRLDAAKIDALPTFTFREPAAGSTAMAGSFLYLAAVAAVLLWFGSSRISRVGRESRALG